LLALAVWGVFGHTLHHQFVNFDDDGYVYRNSTVTQGFNLSGIAWAFTHSHGGNWHPLTSLSHMLDYQFYGLKPGGHHLTNVLLHGATAILLFLVLRNLTGAIWRSAFVAAVFCIHPLRVESVAWIAERKDVLSGLFFVLMLGAYARYVEGSREKAESKSPKPEAAGPWSMVPLPSSIFLLLSSVLVLLRAGPAVQAHAGDVAVGLIAAGLLAAGTDAA